MTEGSIIITGASGGMGSAATRALAAKGVSVIMACQDPVKAARVRDGIVREIPGAELEIREIHLDSFASVREFAAGMEGVRIAGLFNNAGTLPRRYSLSEDGYEMTLAVNYIGPYLLTRLLLPRLGDGAAVVNMVSLSARYVRFSRDILHPSERDFSQLGTYAASKLALICFTAALSERCPGLKVNAADPGIVDTDIIRLGRWFDPLTDVLFRPFCKSPARGAAPALRALLSEESGKYFSGNTFRDIPPHYNSRKEYIAWLWDETEKETMR